MTKTHKKQNSPSLLTLAIIAILFVGGVFALYKKFGPAEKAISTDQQLSWETDTQVDFPIRDNPAKEEEPPSNNSISATEPLPTNVSKNANSCQKISTKINIFLDQLSNQDYIKAYGLDEDLSKHINKIIIKLLNNPPIITSESDDMLTILKNGAHFYHILGPKDISLIKDILAYESEGMENLFASLYSWSTQTPPCHDQTIKFNLQLPKLYEYSAFLFKTLGGQSYLFRREFRLRSLIEYYSVLILDNANKKGLNKYKINLTATLSQVKDDLDETTYLIHKDRYIKTLKNLEAESNN